jgi:sigma-E factor negative regulatory protein RseA
MSTNQDALNPLSQEDAELLSALADGELSDEQAAQACALWVRDERARTQWQQMHYAADVMRSGDLASAPGHDEAFLAAFRERFAKEPVLLAPTVAAPASVSGATQSGELPKPAVVIGHGKWWQSVAMAAGVAVVALGVGRMWGVSEADSLAAVGPTSQPYVAVSSPVAAQGQDYRLGLGQGAPGGVRLVNVSPSGAKTALAQTVAPSAQMIRDANLDRYLAAHHEFAAVTPLAETAAHVRSVSVDANGR